MRVLIICLMSVPTNNETVNLVLLQNHLVDEKFSDPVWKLFYYNKSCGVVLGHSTEMSTFLSL